MNRRPLVAIALVGCLAGASYTSLSQAAPPTSAKAAAAYQPLPEPRKPSAQDRYAPANGCFTVRSVQRGADIPGGPFRFQAFDLGKYLLVAKGGYLATAMQPLPTKEGAALLKGYVDGTGDERIQQVRPPAHAGIDTAATVVQTATAPAVAQVRGDAVSLAAEPSSSAEWVLKPTAGSFVLQQAHDDGDPMTPGPSYPSIAATLALAADGSFRAVSGAQTGEASRFRLLPAKGCPAWTETAIGVAGPLRVGSTPYEQTKGYLDAHMHLMAQEFLGGRMICGRVWHPYGVTKALVDCPDHAVAGGRGAVVEDFLAGHNPGTGHDPIGWPSFRYWPNPHSLTHQGSYYGWLERSWRAGQRMLTVLLVENGQLCELYPLKKYSCDEMASVRREALRTFELQRFVDAQYGGPGRGWFRIVKDPQQARRVVNAGRLAVVLGIEVSRPLGCREYLGSSSCTDSQVDQALQEVYDLGVRQMELTNKFDNAFTGVKGDSGALGVLVNSANNKETGHFWKLGTCKAPFGKAQHDHQQYNLADESGGQLGRDALFGAILATSGPSGLAPAYPAGPHCNEVGLTEQGRLFLDGMVKRGMIFDPDHMSAKARSEAMALLAKRGYSGVISSHSWADEVIYNKVLSLGGVVTPYAGGSSGFLGAWGELRAKADPRFLYGIGWGSDINGFGSQGGPRNPAAGKGVRYPFTGAGGVTVTKVSTGTRSWDINSDGVAHYGLYPDWVQDIKVQAGRHAGAFQRDLDNGVEAYLQMWERATGIRGDSCRADIADVTPAERRAVRRGMTPEQVVATLGQPHTRIGRTYTYCGTRGTVTIRFTPAGRVA